MRRLLPLALLPILLALPQASSAHFPSAFPPVAHNPADRMATVPIEDYRYDVARARKRTSFWQR